MKTKKEYVNVRVWRKSWLKLKVLAAKRDIRPVQMFDDLVS